MFHVPLLVQNELKVSIQLLVGKVLASQLALIGSLVSGLGAKVRSNLPAARASCPAARVTGWETGPGAFPPNFRLTF